MEHKLEIPFKYSVDESYDEIQYYILTKFENIGLPYNITLNDNSVVIETDMTGIIEIMRKSVLDKIQYIADGLIDVYAFTNPIVHAETTDLPLDSIITEEKFEKYLDYLEKQTVEQEFQSAMEDFRYMDERCY